MALQSRPFPGPIEAIVYPDTKISSYKPITHLNNYSSPTIKIFETKTIWQSAISQQADTSILF